MKPKIAILASGGGTTTEAFIRANQNNEIAVDVELVIVSRKDAGIFERIESLNKELNLSIKTILVNHMTHPPLKDEIFQKGYQTKNEEIAILDLLKNGDFDLIASLGYMKRIGATLVKEFGWVSSYKSAFQAKMVNTHPGLLPDTKGFYGENIQKYVLDRHLPYGGQSLHLVSEEYDEGPILAEHKVEVELNDTPQSLFARVQEIEKKYLPKDIEDFILARKAYNEENGGTNG